MEHPEGRDFQALCALGVPLRPGGLWLPQPEELRGTGLVTSSHVTGGVRSSADCGVNPVALNGQQLGGLIDLYNDDVVATGELDFGRHELDAGEHKLSVTITGANAKAVKS